jgi:hypothetical protein
VAFRGSFLHYLRPWNQSVPVAESVGASLASPLTHTHRLGDQTYPDGQGKDFGMAWAAIDDADGDGSVRASQSVTRSLSQSLSRSVRSLKHQARCGSVL